MPQTPLSIIFDLDGTLVDTAPDLLASLNAVLVKEGRKAVQPRDLRHLVGYGARAMFEHALEDSGAPVAPALLASLTEQFLTYYRANIARGSRPFPKVAETLDRLALEGVGLGVCTNKPHDLTELLLTELDLTRHFSAVLGAGRVPYSKPDPRHVLDVVTALKGTPDRTVLVGDSPVDVAAARAAKIPVIVMSYGYTPIPPAEMGADAVTGDFGEIPGLVARLVA